uniref:Uncharacterized protein n=1 Tax=Nephromyces sp. ex Molgula occidentalis TaxID=2544991 RepID=A0A5C1H845_9APIC|nr:hypothetical protein [Nephromyces sp. ex Molgula occidentalis]
MIKILFPYLISLKIKNLTITKTSTFLIYKFLIDKKIDKIYIKSIFKYFINLNINKIRTQSYSKNNNFKKVFITIKI